MAQQQNAKRGCLVCGELAVGGVAPPFAFCGGCCDRWIDSYERVRWASRNRIAAAVALTDFVRRLKAEKGNGQ